MIIEIKIVKRPCNMVHVLQLENYLGKTENKEKFHNCKLISKSALENVPQKVEELKMKLNSALVKKLVIIEQ